MEERAVVCQGVMGLGTGVGWGGGTGSREQGRRLGIGLGQDPDEAGTSRERGGEGVWSGRVAGQVRHISLPRRPETGGEAVYGAADTGGVRCVAVGGGGLRSDDHGTFFLPT